MVEPKSLVNHVGGGTLDAGSSFKTYLNFRNNLFMLFKNLHISTLLILIPLRLFLDGIAAFTFLSQKKGLQHFLAIPKAHLSFYIEIPKLILKRRKLTNKRKLSGKVNYSILLKNKIKGITTFSNL
jgi:hypothetical protein